MTCPTCLSATLELDGHCPFCGASLSIADEVRLRAAMLAPHKDIEEARLDYAIREGSG